MQIPQTREIHLYIISVFIITGFFTLVGLLIFFDIKDGSKEIVYTLLGTLGASFGAVINYFFGSSEGSKDKTKLLKG